MSLFNEKMHEYINLINDNLDKYLAYTNEQYDNTIEAMRYSVIDAGKRIRPILALEFCKLNGGNIEDAIPFACAVEMIHCSSLIHDDMPCMDDDDLRRGKPSCHKKFGEATALLAGDALITLAFDIMTRETEFLKKNPIAVLGAVQELSNLAGIKGMMGGQAIDLFLETQKADCDILKQMHSLKTSALIKSACKIGTIIANAEKCGIMKAELYSENLGLAFQTIDDILDIVGEEKELGKPIGSDKDNNKSTFVTLLGMDKANEMAKNYTSIALESIEEYEDNNFIKELTQNLLNRNK